jgi:cadmium resistance protein CadD (predicted permease)
MMFIRSISDILKQRAVSDAIMISLHRRMAKRSARIATCAIQYWGRENLIKCSIPQSGAALNLITLLISGLPGRKPIVLNVTVICIRHQSDRLNKMALKQYGKNLKERKIYNDQEYLR